MMYAVMCYDNDVFLEIVISTYVECDIENTNSNMPFARGLLIFLTIVAAK